MILQRTTIIPHKFDTDNSGQNLTLTAFLLRCLSTAIVAALFVGAGNVFAAGSGLAVTSQKFAPGHVLAAPRSFAVESEFQRALIAQGGRSLGRINGTD